MTTRRILFACISNTCRSPMAEAIFLALTTAHPNWFVRSAGISAWDSLPITPDALIALKPYHLDFAHHRAKCITTADIDWADIIFTFTQRQLSLIQQQFSHAAHKMRLMTHHSTQHDIKAANAVTLAASHHKMLADNIETALRATINSWQ